jgi:peroxiredoxin
MAIQPGDTIPNINLKTPDGKTLSTDDLCRGKKVVLFAVPGAFTPTCSDHHLPGFVTHAADLKSKGVDTIACVAVNDHHVMGAWANARGTGDQILMLADGNGEFARAMGLEADINMHALFFAAPVIDEPVAAHGPFVMNTMDEVRRAYADYQAGRFVDPPRRSA